MGQDTKTEKKNESAKVETQVQAPPATGRKGSWRDDPAQANLPVTTSQVFSLAIGHFKVPPTEIRKSGIDYSAFVPGWSEPPAGVKATQHAANLLTELGVTKGSASDAIGKRSTANAAAALFAEIDGGEAMVEKVLARYPEAQRPVVNAGSAAPKTAKGKAPTTALSHDEWLARAKDLRAAGFDAESIKTLLG